MAAVSSVQFSVFQHQVKYEDAVLVDLADGSRSWGVFAVLDGHNSESALHYCREHLVKELEQRMPSACTQEREVHQYSEQVRVAVTATFLSLNEITSSMDSSGTSLTLLVYCGRLLTVASVGDALCVADTAQQLYQLTQSHKISQNGSESQRLTCAGATLAQLKLDLSGPCGAGDHGCGPLRLWPGGTEFARALGVVNRHQAVLPYPHIQQVLLPDSPCRLIMGTDGVWDALQGVKACTILRSISIHNAAQVLVRRAVKQRRVVADDVSAVVVDFLPVAPEPATFKSLTRGRQSFEARARVGVTKSRSFGELMTASSLHRSFSDRHFPGGDGSSRRSNYGADDSNVYGTASPGQATRNQWQRSFASLRQSTFRGRARTDRALSLTAPRSCKAGGGLSERCADDLACSQPGEIASATPEKGRLAWLAATVREVLSDRSLSPFRLSGLRSNDCPAPLGTETQPDHDTGRRGWLMKRLGSVSRSRVVRPVASEPGACHDPIATADSLYTRSGSLARPKQRLRMLTLGRSRPADPCLERSSSAPEELGFGPTLWQSASGCAFGGGAIRVLCDVDSFVDLGCATYGTESKVLRDLDARCAAWNTRAALAAAAPRRPGSLTVTVDSFEDLGLAATLHSPDCSASAHSPLGAPGSCCASRDGQCSRASCDSAFCWGEAQVQAQAQAALPAEGAAGVEQLHKAASARPCAAAHLWELFKEVTPGSTPVRSAAL